VKRFWKKAPWWRRLLAVLNVLVVVLVVVSFLIQTPLLWWLVPAVAIEGGTFALLTHEKGRKQRDGSYWGPRL